MMTIKPIPWFWLCALLWAAPAAVAAPLAMNWNNAHAHTQNSWSNSYVWPHARCLRYMSAHPDLLILGDSIFDGWSGYLLHVFPQAVVDARVSRQFSRGVEDYAGLLRYPGIYAIQTVVVELGTNGPITHAQIRQFMSLVGQRRVIWITPSVPRPWQSEVVSAIHWAAHHYSNIEMVPWHSIAQGHPAWFRGGGVHPNWAGIQHEVSALSYAVATCAN